MGGEGIGRDVAGRTNGTAVLGEASDAFARPAGTSPVELAVWRSGVRAPSGPPASEYSTDRGPVAQLGERHNGIVEVRGSSPLRSIRLGNNRQT